MLGYTSHSAVINFIQHNKLNIFLITNLKEALSHKKAGLTYFNFKNTLFRHYFHLPLFLSYFIIKQAVKIHITTM